MSTNPVLCIQVQLGVETSFQPAYYKGEEGRLCNVKLVYHYSACIKKNKKWFMQWHHSDASDDESILYIFLIISACLAEINGLYTWNNAEKGDMWNDHTQADSDAWELIC